MKKKLLLLILSAFIVLSFTACKGTEPTSGDEPFAVEEIEADPFYKEMKDLVNDNLRKKRDLLARAEELKNSTEWKETADAFIALQEEWKKVGPVARKYSDDLWKQFRDACDTFFNAKRDANRGAREAFEQKRAAAKANFTKRVDAMTDRQKLVRMYENLQQEIKTAENNILFFSGNSKSANQLVDSMRKKIDGLKEQLKELEDKINAMD